MKKILYLVTQSEFGGAQKYITDLTENLLTNKYIIEIAVGEKRGSEPIKWLEDLSNKGFKIWRLKHVVREINLWHDFLSAFELYFLFKKSNPDIIHLNSSKIGSTGAVMAWFYKKLNNKKIKIIYTVHGFVFNENLSLGKKIFYQLAEKNSGHFKDKIICVSEQDKISGLNYKVAHHSKFITIHNGIDFKKIYFFDKEDARQKLITNQNINFDQNTILIGTIANLYFNKGLIYMIRAAKIITEKMPQMVFIVIGEGEQRKNLVKEIKQLNLEKNFFLMGALVQASQYLKAFDVFCLPSIKEGFPYTLLEAMAAGLPIVSTPVGGIQEIIIDEQNGLIVPKEKPREIAKALEKILKDKNLIEKISQNNLQKIKEFSLEKMVSETEKVYEE